MQKGVAERTKPFSNSYRTLMKARKNPSQTLTEPLRKPYRTLPAQDQPQLRELQLVLGDVVLVLAD